MKEQNYTPGAPPPVEGRVDVARDLEEEQRASYSSHPHGSLKAKPMSRNNQQGVGPVSLPPVEGRVDVAGDLEEEQRASYSSHHHGQQP